MASAWRLDHLVATYRETTQAVVTLAANVPPEALVTTQGHVLRVRHLLSTLTVEAAVHHLDLVAQLGRPGPPAPAALTPVRVSKPRSDLRVTHRVRRPGSTG